MKRQRSHIRDTSPSRIPGCSGFRFAFLFSIGCLVYLNIIHLNSRYLTEVYTHGEHAVSMVFGAMDSRRDTIFDQPTNHISLPPIYWINLDISEDRRMAMEDMFRSLGIVDTHRVSAMDINETLEFWDSERLVFHPNITLEEKDGRPSNKKHVENIYEYQEAACLLSHLEAIRLAYEDGHDLVLILEDDASLSYNFANQWKPYVDRAPVDWKILQFATNNPNVVKQGVNLLDYFITWQPYHWSTRAYIINRSGMQTLMDKAHSLSVVGEDIWRIDEIPMVVADEVIYYVIGEAYTSTGLWVDSFNFGSTIQSTNAHKNLSTVIGKTSTTNIMLNNEEPRPESVLVLMNVRARDNEELSKELQWIRQDNHALCSLHETCEWEINLVLTESSLIAAFKEERTQLPKNIHFHTHVSSAAFNKFGYIRTVLGEMSEYDLVLFKDNDQRINGFPWRSFLEQKGNAVVSGPLRQNTDEALLYRHSYPKRQWFQFHAAEAWTEDWNTKWSSKLFSHVVPTEVPLLEMYFVLFDAKFANHFFHTILTPEYLNQTSAWGPDLMWCSAAKEWDPNRPGCNLVPVSSSHEDTRQIAKMDTGHKENGHGMLTKFKENTQFEKWMRAPEKWNVLIGGQLLWEIERRCRRTLKLRLIYPFDLSACSRKVYDMAMQSKKGLSAQEAHVIYQKMNAQAKQRLSPLTDHAGVWGSSRGGTQNQTRVSELVQAVKAARNVTRGTTNRNPAAYLDEDRQRKSLDAFQARLADLKQARAERLFSTGGKSTLPDDANKEGEREEGSGDAQPLEGVAKER